MKVCPITKISSPAPEICLDGLLTGYVFCMDRVFLYNHGHSGRQHPPGILGVYDRSGV